MRRRASNAILGFARIARSVLLLHAVTLRTLPNLDFND